jgi:hypothetical protein
LLALRAPQARPAPHGALLSLIGLFAFHETPVFLKTFHDVTLKLKRINNN